jgi:hypothetical protein
MDDYYPFGYAVVHQVCVRLAEPCAGVMQLDDPADEGCGEVETRLSERTPKFLLSLPIMWT